MSLTLERNPSSPNSASVKNEDGDLVGTIDQIAPNEWRNTHLLHGKVLNPVPRGPLATMTAAFDEFVAPLYERQ